MQLIITPCEDASLPYLVCMHIWVCALLSILTTLTVAVAALETSHEPVTLSTALGRALAINPSIESALVAAEAADYRAKQQRGALLPEGRYQGTWGIQRQDEQGANRTRHPHSEQVVVSQPLTIGEEYAGWQAAQAEADAALARAQVTTQDILLRVAAAYSDALAARDSVRALNDLVIALEQQRGGIKRQYELGESTKAAVALVSARLAAATKDLESTQGNLDEAVAQIEQHTGLDLQPTMLVWPEFKSPRRVALPKVMDDHPLVREARARVVVQRYRQMAAGAEIFPEINLSASVGRQAGELASNPAWSNKVMLSYAVPLFSGGRTIYGLKAATLEKQAAQSSQEAAVYQVRSDYKGSLAVMDQSQRALAEAQRAVDEQETAITGARLEYENGERSLTDLLDAEQERASARLALSTAKRGHLMAIYRVRAATGDLTLP